MILFWAVLQGRGKEKRQQRDGRLLLAEGLHFCFPKQLVFYFLMTLRVWTLPSAWMSRMM